MRQVTKKIRVLVSAGPTKAYLDDVRFLSNYSTGELGYLVCKELKNKFDVILVSGPTSQPYKSLKLKAFEEVTTNQEMRASVLKATKQYQPHFFISTAAVLDFEPVSKKTGKVTSQNNWVIQLKPAPKIIDEVKKKYPKTKIIAFKLETQKLKSQKNFVHKYLKQKDLFALCLNYLPEINKTQHLAKLYTPQGIEDLKTKSQIAKAIKKTIEKDLKIPYNS
jgi:phosphopantothenoylcysteine decarboxylase/phosphopantothenate--cysteine ligase